ncbi:MAG TPA: aldolase catalytic domain-containing protein [Candidatus Anaerostipes excrementavium]|uniref:Aldolase catalytic domain-containing protein n=1 Tax=Candidatus Anaerostipes excrementavium TaxID=2838463 RepID=A0A9D1WWP8_9FIRM|nr:aldolase catalytic domain-containing protein [uncultured Anaerostipes sp.]HIX68619.1 aldolase catalytic domain-containing protein [Candidatus Anaerostipes excrementavium]
MNKISVLDCTLRDGGYVNDFNFSKQTIQTMITKLGKAHIDIIECGFLRDVDYQEDRSVYSRIEQITPFITPKRKHSMYVAMIVTGTIQPSKIVPRTKDTIDGIRITFHKKEMDEAFTLGYALMDKGYEVFMQPVGTTTYTDAEILALVEKINEMKPFAFYLVDTLGKLYAKQLLKLFYLVDDNLDEEIAIGYHSHNNLQLAFSNAQELILSSGKRDLLIDASILGMGRGAGNLCTEILTQYINENLEYRYHTELLIELVDEYISPISYIHPWGYSAGYFLAATNNCHPNYVGFLLNKQTINVKKIYQVLKEIPEEERALYNEKLIDSLYLKFQENEVDDEKVIQFLKDKMKGRHLLVTAPGKSILEEKEKIKEQIEQDDVFVICVNSIPDYIAPDILFISNQKRYHQIKQIYGIKNLTCPVVLTSNIDAGKSSKYVVNYSDLTMSDTMISDNACLMLFNLLIKMGIDEICVAGFDGYHTNVERNYYARNLINSVDRENLSQINKHIQKYMEKVESHMKVRYLTESMYDRSKEHVHQN